jgi:hypothetical protein
LSNIRRLLPQIGAMVGYKIGCTSAVMQQYLNIPSAARGLACCSSARSLRAALLGTSHENGLRIKPSIFSDLRVDTRS